MHCVLIHQRTKQTIVSKMFTSSAGLKPCLYNQFGACHLTASQHYFTGSDKLRYLWKVAPGLFAVTPLIVGTLRMGEAQTALE